MAIQIDEVSTEVIPPPPAAGQGTSASRAAKEIDPDALRREQERRAVRCERLRAE
jgi:hypothetical protein